ncbi:MAG: hypothetical protein VX897_03030, partial [Actinomycetota bacterium]|nr:hypothetical protein [Actinomycetota bacterium]
GPVLGQLLVALIVGFHLFHPSNRRASDTASADPFAENRHRVALAYPLATDPGRRPKRRFVGGTTP